MIFSSFGSKNAHLKIPIGFLFTFWLLSKQTADWQKNVDGIKWRAIDDERLEVHSISVPSTVTKPKANLFCKQTADLYVKNFMSASSWVRPHDLWHCPSNPWKGFEKIWTRFGINGTYVLTHRYLIGMRIPIKYLWVRT